MEFLDDSNFNNLSSVLSQLTISAISENVQGRRFRTPGRLRGKCKPPSRKITDAEFSNIKTEFFTQYVDHNDPSHAKTFKQRYFVDEQYASVNKNVAFLYIDGEEESDVDFITRGEWVESAKKFNATLFLLEHRYYGQSVPTEDISTENLKYLTVDQVLADTANFIEGMKVQYKLAPDVKWIVFGCSYSGALVAWFRQKYPDLTKGGVSSSAPLVTKLNFADYHKVVYEDIRSYRSGNRTGEECMSAIQKAFQQLDSHVQNRDGQSSLDKMFKLCDSITEVYNSAENLASLTDYLLFFFTGTAQYNKDNTYGSKPNLRTIDTVCDVMLNTTVGSELQRLALINKQSMEEFDLTCLDYKYEKMIQNMKNVTDYYSGRQWYYQTCTTFGYYQPTEIKPQIYGDKVSLEYYLHICEEVFGPTYNRAFVEKAVEETNKLYGGLNIKVSNVVFLHGSFDPWHQLGITHTKDEKAPAIYMKGAAHCANTYPAWKLDTPEILAAREKTNQLIASWLS